MLILHNYTTRDPLGLAHSHVSQVVDPHLYCHPVQKVQGPAIISHGASCACRKSAVCALGGSAISSRAT